MSNKPAAVLPTPNTGDASFDDAAKIVQAAFGDESPALTKAFKRLEAGKPGDDARFVSLFVKQAFDFGGSGEWNEDRVKKMTPAQRKEYKSAHDAAYASNNLRERYFGWLVERLARTEKGCARLLDAVADPKVKFELRHDIVDEMRKSDTPFGVRALAARFPPKTWPTIEGPAALIIKSIVESASRDDAKHAWDAFSAIAKKDAAVAEGVLGGIDAGSRPVGYGRWAAVEEKKQRKLDARWADIALPLLASKDEDIVGVAIAILLDVGPRAEWQLPARKAHAFLEKKYAETEEAELLIEEIEKLAPAAPAAASTSVAADGVTAKSKKGKGNASKTANEAASDAPLPPEKRGKAPKPFVPKSVSVATLAKEADAMLAKAGLAKHRAALVQPAVHVLTRRVEEKTLAVGASKIGGHPDLPVGTKWPESDGHALGFVAQLRLDEIAKTGEARLPAKGLLLFFVDDEAFGESYLEKAKVIHVTDTKALARAEVPATFQACRAGKPARQAYEACALTFVPTLTVPSASNADVTKLLEGEELEKYEEHVAIEHPELAQILGFRHHGYDAENPTTAQFLFRVTSDAQADMGFGDDDCLDFYVPKKDLAKGDFKKVYPYVGD